MGKTKKNIRAEKNKTKLKGAHLPKGLNITKTEFKVKKIVIREQLKENVASDLLSSKNLNIKECIVRLNHNNLSMRKEALRNLKEIITNYPDQVIKNHLGLVIQSVAKLSLDVECDVRQESCKVLGLVLGNAPLEHVRPFFDILSSYLRCAMTHIQPNVQEDSLLILDVLILHAPTLLSSNSDKIFSSFLDMMSKLRIESKPERTITVNLSSKQTGIKWRTKVLERLNKILKTIITQAKEKKNLNIEQVKNVAENLILDAFDMDHLDESVAEKESSNLNYFNIETPMYFPLLRSHLNRNCSLPGIFKKTHDKKSTFNLIDEGKKIKYYAETLVPLLFDTWLEVRPKVQSESYESLMSSEAAITLKYILDIIQQLCELISVWEKEVNNQDLSDWFRLNYSEEFSIHFICGFPFIQTEQKIGKKNKKDAELSKMIEHSGGSQCLSQNLSICYLYCLFNQKLNKSNTANAKKILNYLTNCVDWKFSSVEITSYFIKLVQLILLNSVGWSNTSETSDLLKNIIKLTMESSNKRISNDAQVKLLIFLCEIISDKNLYKAYGKKIFSKWTLTLANMLCRPQISSHTLKTFSFLCRQNNVLFLKTFDENSEQILENLPNIIVTGVETQFEGKQLIVNLFYWSCKNKPDEISGLLEKVQNLQTKLDDELIVYFKQILLEIIV